MKKIATSSVGLFLAFVILASSSGLFLSRMDCLMSGNRSFKLLRFEDCKADNCQDITDNRISKKCCDFGEMILKMKIDANTKPVSSIHFVLHVPVIPSSISTQNFPAVDIPVFQFADLPPPKPVGEHLALIQQYLI